MLRSVRLALHAHRDAEVPPIPASQAERLPSASDSARGGTPEVRRAACAREERAERHQRRWPPSPARRPITTEQRRGGEHLTPAVARGELERGTRDRATREPPAKRRSRQIDPARAASGRYSASGRFRVRAAAAPAMAGSPRGPGRAGSRTMRRAGRRKLLTFVTTPRRHGGGRRYGAQGRCRRPNAGCHASPRSARRWRAPRPQPTTCALPARPSEWRSAAPKRDGSSSSRRGTGQHDAELGPRAPMPSPLRATA